MYDTITNVLEYLARNPQATAALMTLLGGGAATIATAKIPFVGAAVGTGTVLTAAYQMFIKDYSEEKDNIEMAEMFKKASEDYDKELQGFIAKLKNMNKDQLNKLLSEKDPIVLMHLKNLEQIKAVVKEYEDTIFDSRSSIEAKTKASDELSYYKEMLKNEEQLLKEAQMRQSMRKASIGKEITLRREPGAIDETGSGGQKYQSIDAFLRKMQKLQRDANNTEVNEFKKKQQQIDDLLEHHLQEIADKKLTSQDRERATTEAYNTHQAQTLKNNYDENLRLLQEYLDEKKKMQKASDDKLQSQYDAVESINFSQNLQLQLNKLDGYYQALLALEHLSAEERLAVENEYVQKRQELMAEMYRKEYALNAEVWSAIKAGLDTFTSTLYDTEMTGRERWNAMVENMKMTFITAVSEMILKWLAFQALTGGLFGGFDSGLGSFLGQLFGVNKTSFKTPGMQNDFIYSQSQGVIPFRKDDIILGGTLGGGLNFSGQNTPSFSKSSSDRAIVDRLSSLEKTLGEVGGLISNTIIEYRPIVKTDTISNAKVYTMAKRGEIDMQIITK